MILLYDSSFEGFLSVVYDCYADKLEPEDIFPVELYQSPIFSEKRYIPTQSGHADKVWKGWQKKLSRKLKQLPFQAHLSGEPGIEMKLLQFARFSFASPVPVDTNFGDQAILDIRKAARRVTQEAMRMIQFVRFQKSNDRIYFSGVSPRYDVLPMTLYHFKNRFADQHWLVYDMKRDYGFYYNLHTIEEVTINEKNFNIGNGQLSPNVVHEEEASYQSMWQQYYKNITIRERLNLKCHKNHMPKRYWIYLTEKRGTKGKL
ncbi:MAG: TIGR03915 family putative DNA repair protein [Prolixibacteraceae bacterium]|nr:TIGR03915 family putative DNA repair protein [Prolixibacteraceae bacterium]